MGNKKQGRSDFYYLPSFYKWASPWIWRCRVAITTLPNVSNQTSRRSVAICVQSQGLTCKVYSYVLDRRELQPHPVLSFLPGLKATFQNSMCMLGLSYIKDSAPGSSMRFSNPPSISPDTITVSGTKLLNPTLISWWCSFTNSFTSSFTDLLDWCLFTQVFVGLFSWQEYRSSQIPIF